MPDSVYKQILDAVQVGIVALSLTDIADANVVVQKHAIGARKGDLPGLPGVVIVPGRTKTISGGTNERDDITYPVVVGTIQASNTDNTSDMNRMLQWHEDISSAFREQRLGAVTSVYTCKVQPLESFARPEWLRGYDVGGMVLNFISREARG